MPRKGRDKASPTRDPDMHFALCLQSAKSVLCPSRCYDNSRSTVALDIALAPQSRRIVIAGERLINLWSECYSISNCGLQESLDRNGLHVTVADEFNEAKARPDLEDWACQGPDIRREANFHVKKASRERDNRV
jgi:hypothetical protein